MEIINKHQTKLEVKKLLTICLFGLIYCFKSYGQDSIIVFQQDAALFSNSYVFYSNGIFKHYYEIDDGQTWYGVGTYKDDGNKRILRFGDPDLNIKRDGVKIHYESNFERTIKISGKQFLSADYYFTSKKKTVVFSER